MKKVLIIAHEFPPLSIVGALRPFKFAKYLPDFDWEPVILSRKIGNYTERFDETLLAQLKRYVKIYRVFGFEPKIWYYNYSYRLRNNNALTQKKIKNNISSKNIYLRPLKKFLETWIEIPDEAVGWIPFAFFKGMDIIKRDHIDVIYSTSPPISGHMVGLFLSRITKKPWVADFRDPWTQYPIDEYHSVIRKKIDEMIENRLLQSADVVTVTSESTAKAFENKYPSIDRKKIITITNGYDPSDFENSNVKINNEKFIITHTGAYYARKSSNKFLEALYEFLKLYPQTRTKILVRFVGTLDDITQHLIVSLKLEDVIEFVGYVPYQESIQYQAESDVMLITLSSRPGHEVIIHARLFEHLAIKKPILALIPPEGEAAKIIRETNSGIVVSPDDKDKICEAISRLYSKFRTDGLVIKADDSILKKYERKYLTGCLSKVLQNVVG